jgi:hypothetical protein
MPGGEKDEHCSHPDIGQAGQQHDENFATKPLQ